MAVILVYIHFHSKPVRSPRSSEYLLMVDFCGNWGVVVYFALGSCGSYLHMYFILTNLDRQLRFVEQLCGHWILNFDFVVKSCWF